MKIQRIFAIAFVVGSLLFISQSNAVLRALPQTAAVISSVLVELTNGDRVSTGLATLTVSPVLTQVAQAKADDMAAKGYFAHTSPEGVTPWHWFSEKGYKFSYAGENLAIDFTESADVERAWMNSPTHRANIVGTQFTEIGIAVATGTYQGHTTVFAVQEFGTPAPTPRAAAQAQPKPVKVIAAAPVATDVALATTLQTPAAQAEVLGTAAGAYLKTSANTPWWFPIVHYFW